MNMARQYVQIKFSLGDRRTYTYHNDGDPVKRGDEVLTERRGGGANRVVVVGVSESGPTSFETKAILGLAPPMEDATA
jgi:hypothetical protein